MSIWMRTLFKGMHKVYTRARLQSTSIKGLRLRNQCIDVRVMAIKLQKEKHSQQSMESVTTIKKIQQGKQYT